jgi:hypothetical protein
MSDLEPRLTNEDAQRVIARALELQTQSADALTMTQVRQIASELSIPESAVDQALSEHRAAPQAVETAARSGTAPTAPSSRERHGARPLMMSMAVVGGAFILLSAVYVVLRLFP